MNNINTNNFSYSFTNKTSTGQQAPVKQANTKHGLNKPSFAAGKENFAINWIDKIMRKVKDGGFIYEFLVVDFLGMIIPRTYVAYQRNREELGRPNYKAAQEEFTREILSGPSMLVIPLLLLASSKRMFGSASHVNRDMLQGFKKVTENLVNNKNVEEGKNLVTGFYKGIVEKLYGESAHDKDKLVNAFENFHNASGKNNIKKAKEDLTEAIISTNKAIGNSEELGISLEQSAKIKFDKDKKPMDIGSFVDDCRNYSTDVINKLSEGIKRGDEVNEKLLEKIHKFKEGARKLVTTTAVAAISGFLFIIPRIYTQNKQYPGLDGLILNPEKNVNGNQPCKPAASGLTNFSAVQPSASTFFNPGLLDKEAK